MSEDAVAKLEARVVAAELRAERVNQLPLSPTLNTLSQTRLLAAVRAQDISSRSC